MPLLRAADSFYDSRKFALASKAYVEAIGRARCNRPVGDSSDREAMPAYALARLLGASIYMHRDGLRGRIGACRLDKSYAGDYDKAIENMRAHRFREAFHEFRIGYSKTRQTKILTVVSDNPYDAEISQVFVGLQAASNGDYVRARSLLRSALQKAEPGEISSLLFLLAQLDLVASNVRSAEKGLAEAIVPRQAYTSFPALPVASWAAAYQLQEMILTSHARS